MSTCKTPQTVTFSLNYFNTAIEGLENAFVKPNNNPGNSPFVKYVQKIIQDNAPKEGEFKTPLILSKGFFYYLMDLNLSGVTGQTNVYNERWIFGQSQLFGNLTALSHVVPALFSVKELDDETVISANLERIKTAVDGVKNNPVDLEKWKESAAWNDENAQKLKTYYESRVAILSSYVDAWAAEGKVTDTWSKFIGEFYPAMINTFFIALLSEANILFNKMVDWASQYENEYDFQKAVCVVAFSTDNPLGGKPSSDLSLVTSAESRLMNAFLQKVFKVKDEEINVKDEYAEYAGTSENLPERIFAFPTTVPGVPNPMNCPGNPVAVDAVNGVTPNSILLGTLQ